MVEHRRSLYEGTSDFLWICMAAEVYSPKPRTVSAGSYSSNLADAFCPPFAEERFLICDSILRIDQNFKGPLPGNFCFLRTGGFIVEAALNWELLPIIFLLHWNTQKEGGWQGTSTQCEGIPDALLPAAEPVLGALQAAPFSSHGWMLKKGISSSSLSLL